MRVVIASETDGPNEQLRHMAQQLGLVCAAADSVTFDRLDYRLAQGEPTDLVLVTGEAPERTEAAVRYASAHAGAPVYAVTSTGDPQLMVRYMRAGARQCLDPDRLRDELHNIAEHAGREAPDRRMRGRVYAVTAVRPGTGVTTVATNLAFALVAGEPGQVALAEVGSDVPELGHCLELDVRHGVSNLAEHLDRCDPRMLRQAMVEHKAGVHVLGQKTDALTVEPPSASVLRHLIVLLRSQFRHIVLDLGHSAHGGALEAMKVAEVVLIVVGLDVPSLRMGRRYLKLLAESGVPQDRVKVAANRYGQSGQIPWRKAEETLGLPVLEWVPEDSGTANEALNQGQPLVAVSPRSKIARKITALAAALNGQPAK